MSNTIKDQLKSIKIDIKTINKLNKILPMIKTIGVEGKNHINISRESELPLGKFLSFNSDFKVHNEIFGHFKNMECFWKYIQSSTRDDVIRSLGTSRLRKYVKTIELRKIVNFRAIIADATYQKITQHPTYEKMLIESSLPFDCYYITNRNNKSSDEIRIRPTTAKWIIFLHTEIRSALKEKRKPNFSELMDDASIGIYEKSFNSKEKEKEVKEVSKKEEKVEIKTEEKAKLAEDSTEVIKEEKAKPVEDPVEVKTEEKVEIKKDPVEVKTEEKVKTTEDPAEIKPKKEELS